MQTSNHPGQKTQNPSNQARKLLDYFHSRPGLCKTQKPSSCRNILSFRIKKKTHQTKQHHHETIKILSQWEALEKKVKQHHLPIRGPHWERHWTRPGKLKQSIQPEERAQEPHNGQINIKIQDRRTKKKHSLTREKPLNSSEQTKAANLPEEAEQPPPNSEYLIISDAQARAVSINPNVHRLSILCFCFNKLSFE